MTRSFVIRIFESYFRHRWLNLIPIVIMFAAAIGYTVSKPREYTTQGLIYVPGQSYLATLTNITIDPASPWVSPAQGTANEIKELLQTDTFIRSVILKSDLAPDLAGTPDGIAQLIKDVRTAVWATTQGDNQVLVGTKHKSPVIAYQLAAATIANYTQWRIDASLAQSTVAQTFFTDLIKEYSGEVDTARQALNEYLVQHPGPLTGDRPDAEQIEIERLRANLDQAQARLTSALDKQESTRLAASQVEVNTRQSVYVVDAPTIPDKPATSLRQTAVQGSLFVAVGVLLTVLLIVGGAILDRSFLVPLDVSVNLDLPVLATVPDTMLRRQELAAHKESRTTDLALRQGPVNKPLFNYVAHRHASRPSLNQPLLASDASKSTDHLE